MTIIAGTFKPLGQAANFPEAFELQKQTGPGILSITGDPDPDSLGTYKFAGEHNGLPWYDRTDSAFAVWKDAIAPSYVISIARDVIVPGFWLKGIPVTGTYEPQGTYAGNPEVALVPVSTIRLRIHGRRGGSGARAGYYPASCVWPGGISWASPFQRKVRMDFGSMMKEYFQLPPFPPVTVTGTLTPDIIGDYGGLDFYDERAHWYNAETLYHLWWGGAAWGWILAETFPDAPTGLGPYWNRYDPSHLGAYDPYEGAIGIATVIA